MTHEGDPGGSEDPDRPDDPEDHARLAPLGPAAPVLVGCAGLVGGWVLRRLVESWGGTAPLVGWSPVGALFLVAVILALAARATGRAVRTRRDHIEPQHAVNRLVLARACVLVGALVAGGYAGYALSWVGVGAELADDRILRSLLAALGGLAVVAGGLGLERACRVRSGGEDT